MNIKETTRCPSIHEISGQCNACASDYTSFNPEVQGHTSRAICKAMSVLKFRWASCKWERIQL